MGVCCFSKHEITNSVCSETGMWTDFQQCHPEGTELHKAQSFSSIKLGNYTDADVMAVGEICTTAPHVLRGKHIWRATSCHRAGKYGKGRRNTRNFTSPATKPLWEPVPFGPLISSNPCQVPHAATVSKKHKKLLVAFHNQLRTYVSTWFKYIYINISPDIYLIKMYISLYI